eukprot:174282_1
MSLQSMCTRIIKFSSQYPLLSESYAFIMGSKLETARNLMNNNENEMRILRERAYELSTNIQQKENEYRTIIDTLRDLKKTDPNYMKNVASEIELIKQIENLKNELTNHKQIEHLNFNKLQQSMRNYHQIDTEYRERIKRISYSWGIIWMVCSVGVGTIFAYKLRQNFLNELKSLNKFNDQKDIEKMIENKIEKQYSIYMENETKMNQNNDNNLLICVTELEQSNKLISQQLEHITQDKQYQTSMQNEKYALLAGGVVISVILNVVLVWMNISHKE